MFASSFGQGKNINDSLFICVANKLKNDEKSFQVFQALYMAHTIDKEIKYLKLDCFQTLFITLYNKGVPLVRLIKEVVFIKTFDKISKKSKHFKRNKLLRSYQKLISNYVNYNSDDNDPEQPGGKEYFMKFLNEYFILPATE